MLDKHPKEVLSRTRTRIKDQQGLKHYSCQN